MAVKVQLDNGAFEHFDGEDDQFSERRDGKLEIFRANGTNKVFVQGSWKSVDGKKKPPAMPLIA